MESLTTFAQPVIWGTVTSSSGPIAEASVMIEVSPGPVPDIAALTDFDGRFALGSVGPGSYRIRANADGYGSGTVEFEIAGADIRVEIRVGA